MIHKTVEVICIFGTDGGKNRRKNEKKIEFILLKRSLRISKLTEFQRLSCSEYNNFRSGKPRQPEHVWPHRCSLSLRHSSRRPHNLLHCPTSLQVGYCTSDWGSKGLPGVIWNPQLDLICFETLTFCRSFNEKVITFGYSVSSIGLVLKPWLSVRLKTLNMCFKEPLVFQADLQYSLWAACLT